MTEKFVDIVFSSFSFLENDGFRRTAIAPQLVRYEGTRSFLDIQWDERSGELGAFVGLLPRTGREQDQYSLSDAMTAAGIAESECRPAQVADEARLRPFVIDLADRVRKYGIPALSGDRMYFRFLETHRGAKAAKYMREMKLRQVRAEAELAWHDHRLAEVVSLYESIEDDLTESESRKLEYARRHRSTSPPI